ncbi:MAG: fimbrial biogenesis outer membrane usher protein [Acinetobacter johnsonii]|nr:fimbrial biogenesis outer membrane usher protein [Acinetobacter johnsonii]
MSRTKLFFALQSIFWGLPLYTYANNPDVVINNVWLNGVDRVIDSLVFQQDDQRYMECNVLVQLGLNREKLQQHPLQTEYCLVTTGTIQSEQDLALQAIKLTVPGDFFSEQQLITDRLTPSKAQFGGFLNYNLHYDRDEEVDQMSTLAQLGIFKNYWIFKNDMIYRDNVEEFQDQTVRLSTSFEMEFPEKYQKLTIGDTNSFYNPLLDSFRFGGISFGTNFTNYPDFIYWNVPTLNGSAALPSTVDLYINGVNQYQQQVTPGHYNLNTGANIQQAGEAQIVVEDILGNRTVQNFSVYVTSQLLKPGLSEYNFSLGKLRYDYDIVSDDYRDFFGNAYFRRGITNNTTLGANLVYSEDIQNLGLLWTQALGKYALLDTMASSSHSDLGDGYTVGAAISHSGKRLAYGFSTKYYTQEYQGLGYSDTFENPQYDSLAYLSIYDIPIINNLNINYIDRAYYPSSEISDSQMISIGFSRRIGTKAFLSFSSFKDLKDNDNDGAYISLSYNFDDLKSAAFSYVLDEQVELNYSKSSLEQNGVDYTLGAIYQQDDSSVGFNAFTALKMSAGNLYLSHDENKDFRYSQVDYQGALVWLDKKLAFTKYVDNAFALVNVDDIPDIEVYRALTPVGKTSKDGHIFVHNIVPYVNYELSFNQDQLDMYDSVPQSSKNLVAMDQRGYKIDFEIERTGLIVLHLFTADKQNFALGSELYLDPNSKDFVPIGSDGKAYLYGVKAGTYNLMLKTTGGKICHSKLEVPAFQAGQETALRQFDLICQ